MTVVDQRRDVRAEDPAGSTQERPAAPGTGQDLPELRLVRPLPGFGELERFVLVRLGEDDGGAGGEDEPGLLYELRSLQDPQVRFLVAVPTAFFPGYAFELDEASCEELGLRDAADALVLVVLSTGQEAGSTTANLLAPVVINARTLSAAQVILVGTDWPVRAPIG